MLIGGKQDQKGAGHTTVINGRALHLHGGEENGASTMEEVWGSWKDVVDKLDIKPLERKRIEAWLH